MTKISAVELRNNLGDIIRRVSAGEDIQITYRDKTTVVLSAIRQLNKSNDETMGIDRYLARPKKNFSYDSNKSFKELYDESLKEKYGKYV